MVKECYCGQSYDDDLQMDGEPRRRGFRRGYCSERCQKKAVNNYENQRRRWLWRKYKWTPEDYNARMLAQDSKCMICLEEFDTSKARLPAIDHNRSCCSGDVSCGRCVRGILCNRCNRGLGLLKDDPIRLRRAIDYIGIYNEMVK